MPQQRPLKAFLRGGQTTIHGFRMASQVLGVMSTAFVICLAGVVLVWTFASTQGYDRYLAYKYAVAKTLLLVRTNPERRLLLRMPDGEIRHVTVDQITSNDAIIEARNTVLNRFSQASVFGSVAGGVVATFGAHRK